MRAHTPFFLTLVLLATILLPVLAMGAPSYGEDEPYLGQVVDSYVNNDSVATTYQVIHNQSLGCMELGYSSELWIIEDFTTYTEVDVPANRITGLVDNYYQHNEVRGEDTYVYKDFGVDNFDEFFIRWSGKSVSSGEYGIGNMLTVANYVDDEYYLIVNSKEHITVRYYYRLVATVPTYRIVLIYVNATNVYVDTYESYVMGDWYYFDLNVTDDNIHLDFYSDYERGVLVDDLNIVKNSDEEYRYLFPTLSFDDGVGDHVVQVMNYSVTEGGYFSNGDYYTEEIVGGDQALALMYNATLPADTVMTLELSSDNSSWVNHNNQAGYEGLVAGLESVDLRDLNTTSLYVRVNMTTTDHLATPRMYQLRLVTVIPIISVATVSTAPYLAMAIILLMLGLVLGMRMRR